MKKNIFNHISLRWLLLAVVMTIGIGQVEAARKWRQDTHTKVLWTVEDGVVEIHICYFDEKGSVIVPFDSGLTKDGKMTLRFGNSQLQITCDAKGANPKVSKTYGTDLYDDTGRYKDTNDEKHWLILRWKLDRNSINQGQTITYSGRWWQLGGTPDDDIKGEASIAPTWSRGYIQVASPIPLAKYVDYKGEPYIEVEWNRIGSGNADNLGDILLYKKNGSEIKAVVVDNMFLIPVKDQSIIDINQPNTFCIKQSYTPKWNSSIKYENISDDIKLEAYPQVMSNDNFVAAFNSTTRKIDLMWSIPNAPAMDYHDDRFVVKIVKILHDGTVKNLDDVLVSYQVGQTNYKLEFPVEVGEIANYKFTIYREKLMNEIVPVADPWKMFVRECELNVNTKHVVFDPITPPTAELLDDNRTAKITWKIDGDIWSDGSIMTVSRRNITTQQTTPDVLAVYTTINEINKTGFLEDNTIINCNQYEYILEIKPNSSYGPQTPIRLGPIGAAEIGLLKNLKVSKGYFSNRVDLSWESDGGFNDFAIERKEANTSDDKYIQIATLKGTATGSLYNTSDAYGEAGVVYHYRVKGLVSCNGKVESSEPLTDIGFRTPTGDIYGRVTFENNQAEGDVELILETLDKIPGKSLLFDGHSNAQIDNENLLSANTDSLTLQAWISPDAIANVNQTIIGKDGMYEVGIDTDGKIYFWIGNNENILKSDSLITKYINSSKYLHITALYSKKNNLVELYINGLPNGKRDASFFAPQSNTNPVVLGNNFKGAIDEVRIWDRPLTASQILRDYSRYLIGSESGLIAYYTFNYSTDDFFFDTSFKGADYNANHGCLNKNVVLSENIPSVDQLGYKGMTTEDGAYSIRSIPYIGNGSAYTIIPRKGIHKFKPAKEDRFIGPTSASHTVNFVDQSTFLVSGKVVYKDGTYPVEGVNFKIDGAYCIKDNGTLIATDNEGEFQIRVPVGTHEVKAEKYGHVFRYDGRICDQNGQNLNYQDELRELVISDTTTIRYVGRVAGGSIQEAYPYGHSLSTNNLSHKIKIYLAHKKGDGYKYSEKDSVVTVNHFKPSNKDKVLANEVKYSRDTIEITPNIETGEFVADIFPEKYVLTIMVDGHDDAFKADEIDVQNSFTFTQVPHQYEDSIVVNNKNVAVIYNDTIEYQYAQKFIKRYSPIMTVEQINISNTPLEYFGKKEFDVNMAYVDNFNVPLYDSSTKLYTFKKPVFFQGENYKYRVDVFESYVYKNIDGYGAVDKVPTSDAKITFVNTLADKDNRIATVLTDSIGTAYYQFKAGEPDLTTAIGTMAASFVYGPDEDETSKTSIDWKQPISFDNGNAYILGSHQTGTDFVTAGPNKILTVLRDPPGSNSYSFLEKGVSFNQSANYSGGITHEGSEIWTNGVRFASEVVQLVPVTGSGVVTGHTEVESGISLGIEQEAEYTNSNTSATKSTLTTRFQTSDDPEYVGAMADLFIGYSTNLTFGTTQDITIVPREGYEDAKKEGYVWENVYDENSSSDWVIVQKQGINASTSFNTLFAYPQVHIEEVIIPQLYKLRNSILAESIGKTEEELKQLVNKDERLVFYLSHVPADSEDYGKEDTYSWIYNETVPYLTDTIKSFNESIRRWEKQLAENEEAKLSVTEKEKVQNYSFSGAANIEHSEEYTSAKTNSSSFSISVRLKVSNDFMLKSIATTKFSFEENIGTTQGGEFTTEQERTHSKGFVLAEDGSDYLSVDVFHELGWKEGDEWYGENHEVGTVDENSLEDKLSYSSFIFKTRGGATSCPYEGEYVAKYFEPEKKHIINVATLKKEVPKIAVEKNFIENVPSGETAKIVLYLRNESESNEDIYYDLKLVDSSNPNGARLSIDGSGLGNGRSFLVPAGNTLVKTLEVGKGRVLNYDNLELVLLSQCQGDPTSYQAIISDTVTFHVHFVPSCSDIGILTPTDNWTYNTELLADNIDGSVKNYMNVVLHKFDVNYDDFDHIKLQYKSASESDRDWITLNRFYNDSTKWEAAKDNGMAAEMIKSSDAGKINYKLYMNHLPDQHYDLRAVTVCNINNLEVENYSPVASGIKDMYNPRLFGAPQPANGILTIEDEIRLNFNEPLALGLMSKNNFQVKGVRNGSVTDHSTAIQLDGVSSFMQTDFVRNLSNKDLTFEVWINPTDAQNATIFSHGDINEALELSFTADNYMKLKIGDKEVTSQLPVKFDKGTWAHVALVIDNDRKSISGYYNYNAVIANAAINEYRGAGPITLGRNVNDTNYFNGKMHTARLWDKTRTSGELQLGSLEMLSGTDNGLIAYYPMKEGKGTSTEDKARGANLVMTNCEWSLPNGFAAQFDGTGYLMLETSAAVATAAMNYTIEFWFKANGAQSNAVMLSNGRGEGDERGGSHNTFAIGFDENSNLHYTANNIKHLVDGQYADNQWHHLVMSVSRTTGFAQIFMDGELNTFFDAEELGGIAAINAFVGARGWYHQDNGVDLIVDNYFNGSIDELRLWNLNKTQAIVESFNNEKLNGDEMGLMAYYPFEKYITHQGMNLLEKSLDDHKANTIAKAAIPYGGFDHSTDKAPVKDKGPVANLAFDFVVNNDALIINLTENAAKIEKTIVTFTAMDIRDVNGNKILSPITWTAYIDRNQLRWSEDNLTIEKDEYAPYEFTIQAVNKGGQIQNYSISNQPSWLEVSPKRGRIEPTKSADITFTIDEGLNVGTYNEVIYLTNSNGVSEALELAVTVNGEQPDWSVNPADYKYNMSVFGKMRFKNIFSSDKRDKIAAFQNGKCIGVANSIYSKEFDMWYVMLTVYNNSEKSEGISFRMWEAKTGRTYEAIPAETIKFSNNAIYGSPVNPIIFDGQNVVFQNIALEKGWNWISFNLANSILSDINATLYDGSWTSKDIVKTLDFSENYTSNNKTWKGTLSVYGGGFNNNEMYWMKVDRAQRISVSGTVIDPIANPITIKSAAWNPIGYYPSVNLPLKTALAGYDAVDGDVIKTKDGFAMYYRNTWVGSLTYMEVNCGYMLRNTSNADKTLVYPTAAASNVNSRMPAARMENANMYVGNMNIVATSDAFSKGDKVYAIINGEKRGVAVDVDVNDQTLMFITVAGDENSESDQVQFVIEYANGGEQTASTRMAYNTNSLQGSVDKPIDIRFYDEAIGKVSVSPVPFDNYVTVTTRATQDATMYVEVYDIASNLVYRSDATTINEGMDFIHTVNTTSLAQGTYLINVYENDEVTTCKALKK